MKASTLFKGAISFATTVLLLGAGVAQAAICIVPSAFTNPDPTVTNAVTCGEGSGNSDTAALVNQQEPSARLWTLIDRDGGTGQAADPPQSGFTEAALSLTTADGGRTGNWFIDAQGGFNAFILVLKDGDAIGEGAPKWYWFEIDTAAGCSVGNAPAGTDYCGTWQMYGTNGTQRKELSHMTLYGTVSAVPPTQIPVPEPGSLALFGSALLSFFWVRRRRA